MTRIGLGVLLIFTLLAAGCGYGSHNYMNGNGNPAITSLAPNSATAGGAAFVLTVKGSGFSTDSLVYWGTSTRTTTYMSATLVTADITADDIMNAGMVQVYVHSGGTNSNTVSFSIQ
jgi:hypothetical protein